MESENERVERALGLKRGSIYRRMVAQASARPKGSHGSASVVKAVCQQLGLSEAEFRAVARAQGRPGVGTISKPLSPVFHGRLRGVRGRQVLDEAQSAAEASMPEGASPAELAGEAAQELQNFLDEREGEEAWQSLARAGALIALALDQVAPNYVMRDGNGLEDG